MGMFTAPELLGRRWEGKWPRVSGTPGDAEEDAGGTPAVRATVLGSWRRPACASEWPRRWERSGRGGLGPRLRGALPRGCAIPEPPPSSVGLGRAWPLCGTSRFTRTSFISSGSLTSPAAAESRAHSLALNPQVRAASCGRLCSRLLDGGGGGVPPQSALALLKAASRGGLGEKVLSSCTCPGRQRGERNASLNNYETMSRLGALFSLKGLVSGLGFAFTHVAEALAFGSQHALPSRSCARTGSV